jgi:hypothetical protein
MARESSSASVPKVKMLEISAECVTKDGTGKRARSVIRSAIETAVPAFQVVPRTFVQTAIR